MSLKYSFLMPVYFKENPIFLKCAIESMLNQTFPADEILIVCDGPLTKELDDVLHQYEQIDCVNIIRNEVNQGIGIALQTGINACRNDIILRADSDDISVKERAEIQVPFFEQGYDIVGAAIQEFTDNDLSTLSTLRIPPETNEEIYRYVKKRCPFNHPAVAYRKEIILKAGGYPTFKHMEDYYLWARCLALKAKAYNVQKPLVYMRCSPNMYGRRGGKEYSKGYHALFKFMRKEKMINFVQYCRNICYYYLYSHMNPKLKQKMANLLLRKKSKN